MQRPFDSKAMHLESEVNRRSEFISRRAERRLLLLRLTRGRSLQPVCGRCLLLLAAEDAREGGQNNVKRQHETKALGPRVSWCLCYARPRMRPV